MSHATAAATYQRNSILTASPEKIVKLLYEGAVRNLERVRSAFADPATRRSAEAGESLSRAMGIVSELRSSLDRDVGGEIADNLDRLYAFVLESLSRANAAREPEPVDHALDVMATLKEAWDVVVPG